MQFRLRTLLIVLALGPPVLAVAWPLMQTLIAQRDDLDSFREPFRGMVERYDKNPEVAN